MADLTRRAVLALLGTTAVAGVAADPGGDHPCPPKSNSPKCRDTPTPTPTATATATPTDTPTSTATATPAPSGGWGGEWGQIAW